VKPTPTETKPASKDDAIDMEKYRASKKAREGSQ